MEVLERGSDDNAWPRQFRCENCKSLLSLEVDDIGRNTDYRGDFNSWFIDCPVCLEQPDVPREWWRLLDRLRRTSL